jgi:glucose-6-phosphate-specific signal transduction histidine kinase
MKKLTPKKIYFIAWLTYLSFSFLTFPQLKISVLLFSIPLTMLGGWLYSYKGALLTTVVTIPAHFVLLNLYSDDPAMIRETLNPFGIGSQLVFSCCTALLKSSQDRYNTLNCSLGHLVEERTKELEELAEYLIDAQHFETKELNASLLEKPYKELESMLATCSLLKEQLVEENHARTKDAENIHSIILSCIQQLKTMDNVAMPAATIHDSLPDSIKDLAHQIEQFSDAALDYPQADAWNGIKPEITVPLCELIYEAVGNAMRHADPQNITIGILEHDDALTVFIENDGTPLALNPLEGMGLPLMRYRSAKIGATFNMCSLPDHRTRVECVIPTEILN